MTEGNAVAITADLKERLNKDREELLEKFEIESEFPSHVLTEADELTDTPKQDVEDELDDRADLRHLTTWTTDPVDAQDYDDALSITENETSYTLYVHIADVTHYVTPDTQLWETAIDRATSVYLPGNTIHMLPPKIAETICSLVPNEPRLAHTVEMTLDKDDLGYDSIDIYKSVIESDARLTYSECERLLDEPGAVDDILDDLVPDLPAKCDLVYDLATQMHQQRKETGSLVLNPRRDRAHTIIEESMLKANKAVTHELQWNRGLEAAYRVHPQPTPDEWNEALKEIQDINGVSVPAEQWEEPRKAVNHVLENAPDNQLNKIQRAVLRVMPAARYMNDPFSGHHALNFEIYGHFTSPIRRISDLINHWIVHTNEVPDDLAALCDHATERQRDADACEREYRQLLEDYGIDPNRVKDHGFTVVDDPENADATLD